MQQYKQESPDMVEVKSEADRQGNADVEKPGPDQQQLTPALALVPAAGPQPPRKRPRIQYTLTQSQRQKLESVFLENQYPDVYMRRELARRLYVAETKIRSWFKIRRAKYRKSQMEAVKGDAPRAVQHEGDVLKL
ncbi:rhox homeobox family member 1 [Octodon degus]|uniref:Rhox homeobox family member 1 n=1 Tax=Octodon degus TaxID=10160 RepID=A0A6P6DVD2_OCTDE|nr:rhox homeobox family member 1 [Octodon degus]